MRFVYPLLVMAALGSSAFAEKPSAPVKVSISSKTVGADTVVTFVATPTRAVPAIELRLDGKHLAFGATAAGQKRTITIRTKRATGDVAGQAVIGHRAKSTLVHLGPVEVAKPTVLTNHTLANGRVVGEVRE